MRRGGVDFQCAPHVPAFCYRMAWAWAWAILPAHSCSQWSRDQALYKCYTLFQPISLQPCNDFTLVVCCLYRLVGDFVGSIVGKCPKFWHWQVALKPWSNHWVKVNAEVLCSNDCILMPSVGNNSAGAGQHRWLRRDGGQMLWICSACHTFLLSSYLVFFLDKDEDLRYLHS